MDQQSAQVSFVIGPRGEILTFSDLPPRNVKRWTRHRKAELVAAIQGGLISLAEANKRYSLSVEEFIGWQRQADHESNGLDSGD